MERPAGGVYRHSAPILTDTQRPVTRESFKLAVTLMSHTNTFKQTMSLFVKLPTNIVMWYHYGKKRCKQNTWVLCYEKKSGQRHLLLWISSLTWERLSQSEECKNSKIEKWNMNGTNNQSPKTSFYANWCQWGEPLGAISVVQMNSAKERFNPPPPLSFLLSSKWILCGNFVRRNQVDFLRRHFRL